MTRRILIALATIGALALLAGVCLAAAILLYQRNGNDKDFMSDSESSTELKAELLSSDGANRASHLTVMAGGAAGSCKQFVTVESTSQPRHAQTPLASRDNAVLEISCGSELTVAWASPSELSIQFTVPPGATGSFAQFKRNDKSGAIGIRYGTKA